ncbi:HNH endonuclease [Planosporangium thailandense]|uniref:HNH endonuclease n=2 Tax=Planosporangium thailandense TaxID=765197 RepID=A0ABX0XVE8_9ACTN|nr:HNH endonuclease [Planosporangium thailandense]
MARSFRWVAAVVATTTAATLIVQPAWAASTYSAPLRTAVSRLVVASEVHTGYNRALFPHWIDADHNRCNTRNEVLIAEATTKPKVSSTCALSGGRWYSYYDNRYWTRTSDLDIDHVVPLAEAWESGARQWTTSRRQAYANDLGDSRTLAAVTDNVNQSKGDRDPAAWMPPYAGARCRYLGDWVAVKIRWRLTVDRAEKAALTSWANKCANTTIRVTYAF